MPWVNIFDYTSCSITIYNNDLGEVIPPEDYGLLGLSVSEVDGVVTFEQPDPTNGTYVVFVFPDNGPLSLSSRMTDVSSSIVAPNTTYEARAPIMLASMEWDTNILFETVDPYTPDPLPLTDASTPWLALGIQPFEAGPA